MYALLVLLVVAISFEVNQSKVLETERVHIKYDDLLNSSFNCNYTIMTNEENDDEKEDFQVLSEINQNMAKGLIEEAYFKKSIQNQLQNQIQVQNQVQKQLNQLKETIATQQAQLKSEQVAFSVFYSDGSYSGSGEPIPFRGVRTNRGGHFSLSTYKFRCPITGIYSISFSIESSELSGGTDYYRSTARLYLDGTVVAQSYSAESDPDHYSVHQGASSALLECRVGQLIWLQNDLPNNRIYGTYTTPSTLTGFLVYPLK